MLYLSKTQKQKPLLREYKDVFEGIGQFEGQCSIKLKDKATPVVCASRKVSHALQEKLKAELSSMENKGIIAKVTEPTEWVNALVCVEKRNGNLRICIDPKALNDCIQRPYYPMCAINDISAKLTGAKFFSVLDATKVTILASQWKNRHDLRRSRRHLDNFVTSVFLWV